jgi:hypothetical protein
MGESYACSGAGALMGIKVRAEFWKSEIRVSYRSR